MNFRYILHKFPLLMLMVIFISCAVNTPNEKLSLEERFDRGMEYLEKKKYFDAQQEFTIVVLSGAHTEWGDDAQFYLAESYFKNKEYLLAIAEYERLTRKMKYSPFVEKCRWRICEAYVKESPKYYHDQGNTDKALQKLQEFLDEYPDSEFSDDANATIKQLRTKLANKLLETGELYTKLHAYDSAIVAFKELLQKYYDTDLAENAHTQIIHSYALMKKPDEAQKYFDENSDKIISEELKAKALKYISESKVKVSHN